MTNWYYYNKNGEKITVTAKQLQALAQHGVITPETIIETEEGKTAPASKVKGLTFAEAKPSQVPQPVGTETYSLSQPSLIPLVGEFDFPGSIPEERKLSNYDPFANTAPTVAKASVSPAPLKPYTTFTKPIVLIPVSIAGGMVLMLLMTFTFGMIFGSRQEGNQKRTGNSQTTQIFLKEPMDKEAFKESMKVAFADIPVASNSISALIFSGSWDTIKTVYDVGQKAKDEQSLIKRMSMLRDCYDACMGNMLTQWSWGIKYSEFNPAATTFTIACYDMGGCYGNLEQLMSSVKESIKTLDKTKYQNTIKLYSLLSQYEKAVTDLSGMSYKSYSDSRTAYKEEFTQTMSLAELEW